MGSSSIDFDAAWAEAEAASEPFTVTVLGQVYELPHSLPVKLVLFTQRWKDEHGADMTLEFVIEHLGLLVGKAEVQRWIDEGVTQAKLFEVYLTVVARYRLATSGGDDEGGARPPATGASTGTSSKAGSSSKPTGTASTGGT